jgi:transcriptional regulator GlxA family with amidase domain
VKPARSEPVGSQDYGMSKSQRETGVHERVGLPARIGFLLLPNYTMISMVTALEPLRMANQLAGEQLYQWYLITNDGEPVAASGGVRTLPDVSIAQAPELDALIVVGGLDVSHSFRQEHTRWLRQLDASGVQLGGICTGAFVLAEAGLLDGHECSVHWESMVALQDRHPQVNFNNQLFTVDTRRLTSTGGIAPLDMMLNIIYRAHGSSLANSISEMFILDRIRDRNDQQKVPLRYTRGVAPPKLVEATRLMEANIEEPIPLAELAGLLSVSRRQLERLFRNNLDRSPSRHYLQLRLLRARQLLRQTSRSIIEVASLCGFVSMPHFSKCYRAHLGVTPRSERFGSGPAVNVDESLNIAVEDFHPAQVVSLVPDDPEAAPGRTIVG